jgi:hypothetical protein
MWHQTVKSGETGSLKYKKLLKHLICFILFRCLCCMEVLYSFWWRRPRMMPKNMDEPPHPATASPTRITHLEKYHDMHAYQI